MNEAKEIPNPKKCSKCEERYNCGALVGSCWCSGFDLSTKVLEQIKDDYTDCLCEKCLKEYVKIL